MADLLCVPTRACRCPGHTMPGVRHFVACCDEPHISEARVEGAVERCRACGSRVLVQIFKGTGVCSEDCRKVADWF